MYNIGIYPIISARDQFTYSSDVHTFVFTSYVEQQTH